MSRFGTQIHQKSVKICTKTHPETNMTRQMIKKTYFLGGQKSRSIFGQFWGPFWDPQMSSKRTKLWCTLTLKRENVCKATCSLHSTAKISLRMLSRHTFGRYFSQFLTNFLGWEKVCNAICFLHWTAKITLRTLAALCCTATYRQFRVAKNITRRHRQQPNAQLQN